MKKIIFTIVLGLVHYLSNAQYLEANGYTNGLNLGIFSGAPDYAVGVSGSTIQRYTAAGMASFLSSSFQPPENQRLSTTNTPTFTGQLRMTGSGSGYEFDDRTSGAPWIWYANGGYSSLFNTTIGNVLSVAAANGAVGIGTATPSAKLEVNDAGNAVVGLRVIKTIGGSNTFELANTFSGGSTFAINAGISGISNGGLDIRDVGNAASRLVIDPSGNVGIGTTNPDALLAVKGAIHAQDITIDMTGWSDYVFKPRYKLSRLSEVKNYIDENHHLPDMPSEKKVIENGINVTEMLRLQQKKIEELTLYLIDKDKQLEKQQQEITQQQHQNNTQQKINRQLQEQITALKGDKRLAK